MKTNHFPSKWSKKLHKLLWVLKAYFQTYVIKRPFSAQLQSSLIEGLSIDSLSITLKTRISPKFFVNITSSDSILKDFNDVFPEQRDLIIAKANQVCSHKIDLLGSGLTYIGENIDWHVDFKSGYKFNPNNLYFQIKPAEYPGSYDIKIPWELSRCQHLIWLGQAYWYTHDEIYSEHFVDEINDWISKNQWIKGVNWSCTMDVAIRAINWLWAFHFFINSPLLTDLFINQFIHSLLLHGRFIFNNLERWPNNTTNHYLSNLAGLIYLGIVLPEFKEAQNWRDYAIRELEKEIIIQVYPDGMDFEASTYYHRLVTEIFLTTGLLAQLNEIKIDHIYWERLEKMIEFIQEITQPDGSFSILGDQDNGRIHRLKTWKNEDGEWIDSRYILAIGAVLFNRKDFGFSAGDQWEEAFWFFGNKARLFYDDLNKANDHKNKSICFPDAGMVILKDQDFQMTVIASPNGQNGMGGHSHNDKLSYTLQTQNQDWFIDPGTYLYTSDYEARQFFRSTRSHNTICIDGQEQNRCSAKSIFVMEQDTFPKILNWVSNENYDLLDIIRDGSAIGPQKPNHRRQIYYKKGLNSYCIVKDLMLGENDHQIETNYHLGNVKPIIISSNTVELRSKNDPSKQFGMRVLGNGINFKTNPCWHSRSFGKKEQQDCLRFSHLITFPSTIITFLCWDLAFELLLIDEIDLIHVLKIGLQQLKASEAQFSI